MDPNYQEKFNDYLDNAPLSKYSDLNKVKDWDSNLDQNDRNANIINDLQVHDPSFNYYAAWKDSGEPALNRFNTERSYYNASTNSINMSSDSPEMFQEEIGHALQNKLYRDGYTSRQSISNVIYRKPESPHDRSEFRDYHEDGLHPYRLIDNILNTDYNKTLRHPASYLNRGNYQSTYPDNYFQSSITGIIERRPEYNNELFINHMVNEQQKLKSVDKYANSGLLPSDYAENKVYDITQPMSYYTYGNVENENHNYIQPAIIEPKYNVANQKANAWNSTIKTLMGLKQQ
jgi:hypothetical protein